MQDKNVAELVKAETILYLSHEMVQGLGVFDFSSNRSLIEEAYRTHWRGETRLCHSDYLTYEGRSSYDRIITLLGYLGGRTNVSGLKQICSSTLNAPLGFPRASGMIILNDPLTQRPFCIMEAAQISAARTAAVTSLSVAQLSPDRIQKWAVVGCGFLAGVHLLMWSQLYVDRLRVVHIYDTDPAAMSGLQRLGESLGLTVRLSASAEDAIIDADLITPITTELKPYVEAAWIKDGSLYSAVSLLDPKLDVFLNADYVVVDDEALCKHEGRPLQVLEQRGELEGMKIYSMGQLICEDIRVRKTGREKIIFNPMGTVITDLVVAKHLFDKAVAENVGLKLPA